MRRSYIAFAVLVAAVWLQARLGAPAPGQVKFPDRLLDGEANFNLAIFLQGDLRGNFGPCG